MDSSERELFEQADLSINFTPTVEREIARRKKFHKQFISHKSLAE